MTIRKPNPNAILVIIICSYMMILLDTSIVITGIPHIQADLGLGATALSWVQSIYTLFFGGFLLLGARIGDRLGGQQALRTGLVIFMIMSLAIALAKTAAWLLIARAGQGIGAAIIAPAALTLLATNFEQGEARNRAVAWYGSTAGIGAALGLVLGGWLADAVSWRAGFLLNLPVGALMLVASSRYLRKDKPAAGHLDSLGAILSTMGIGSLIFGVSQTAETGWTSTVTLTSLAAGTLLIAVFIWHEARTRSPLVPLHLFCHRRRMGAYIARFLFLGPMVGFFFFGSQFMQGVLGYSSMQAGLGFMPMTACAFAAPFIGPRLIRRFGDDAVMIGGLLTIFFGMAWLSFIDAGASYWASIALPMVLIGTGQGFSLAPMTAVGISDTTREEAGAASGLVNVAHQVGASFGLGLLASIATAAGQGHASTTEALVAGTRAVFTFGSGMLLLAAIVGGLLIRRRKSAIATDAAVGI
ncbi:MFS transporter [Gluconobacter kanchanaburiensis NBRC 103587]|uniref:MFS transporter n=2 Tax=Gluconobacter kanchanaburiensis TaxID=563199 RepID=A0A511BAE7_9PROT|nr:drug resistance efflux protein [Gluconobacter kanchanaburiensis NBRC 103587]GEK97378.1 MFS transporter [Gluconobacter kanchanaburiensis NBRC 103587]